MNSVWGAVTVWTGLLTNSSDTNARPKTTKTLQPPTHAPKPPKPYSLCPKPNTKTLVLHGLVPRSLRGLVLKSSRLRDEALNRQP